MTLLTASLYLLCLAVLFGSALFIYARAPHVRLNRLYALLALSLLGWVGTLFVFGSLPEGRTLLLVGRANFAAAVVVATASYLFTLELSGSKARWRKAIWLETLLLAALSLGTPLIDQAETVRTGQHLTAYGLLFSFYILHIVAFLCGAIVTAFRPSPGTSALARQQLPLVGGGILATALVGVTANIILPYGFRDFRFIHVGTLSTIFLLIAVSYAVFARHLFNVRVIIRKALVYAALISLALEVYQGTVAFLTNLLPVADPAARHLAATTIALIVNAVSQEPLRKWLEAALEGRQEKQNPEKHQTRQQGGYH